MPTVRNLFVVLVVLGTVPSIAAAQDDPVPLELVVQLLAPPGGPGRTPEIHVGRLPGSLADLPVPGGARIVGGMDGPRGTSAVLWVPGDPVDALARVVLPLHDAGFRQFQPRPRPGFGWPGRGENRPLCRDGEGVQVLAGWAVEGATYVRLVQPPDPTGLCTDRTNPAAAAHFEDSPIPHLELPEGAIRRSGGGGGGGEDWRSDATMETHLSAAELLRHFGDQLVAAGWEVGDEVAGASVAVASYRLRGPAGPGEEGDVPWSGTLTLATDLPGGLVRASVSAARARAPR